jgi:hypothetical protein
VARSSSATPTAAPSSDAATGHPNIKALVRVAAYAFDGGEAVGAADDLGAGTSELTKYS